MHLWQLDIVGGVPLADGRRCKVVTGIDDHSRFVVIAQVVAVPSARAVCQTFTAAMRRYGVPAEVLTVHEVPVQAQQFARCGPAGATDGDMTLSPSGKTKTSTGFGHASGGIGVASGNLHHRLLEASLLSPLLDQPAPAVFVVETGRDLASGSEGTVLAAVVQCPVPGLHLDPRYRLGGCGSFRGDR